MEDQGAFDTYRFILDDLGLSAPVQQGAATFLTQGDVGETRFETEKLRREEAKDLDAFLTSQATSFGASLRGFVESLVAKARQTTLEACDVEITALKAKIRDLEAARVAADTELVGYRDKAVQMVRQRDEMALRASRLSKVNATLACAREIFSGWNRATRMVQEARLHANMATQRGHTRILRAAFNRMQREALKKRAIKMQIQNVADKARLEAEAEDRAEKHMAELQEEVNHLRMLNRAYAEREATAREHMRQAYLRSMTTLGSEMSQVGLATFSDQDDAVAAFPIIPNGAGGGGGGYGGVPGGTAGDSEGDRARETREMSSREREDSARRWDDSDGEVEDARQSTSIDPLEMDIQSRVPQQQQQQRGYPNGSAQFQGGTWMDVDVVGNDIEVIDVREQREQRTRRARQPIPTAEAPYQQVTRPKMTGPRRVPAPEPSRPRGGNTLALMSNTTRSTRPVVLFSNHN